MIFLIQWLRSGGAEKQLLLTAAELSERGVNCAIWTLSGTKAHPRIERLVNDARTAGVFVYRPSRLAKWSGFHLARLALTCFRSSDVLWTWGTRADIIGKCIAVLNPKLMLFCSLRSADADRILRHQRLERFMHHRVSAYISNSWKNCELLNKVVPGVPQRSTIIYNALEEDELKQAPVNLPDAVEKLRVVMLGNIRAHLKGYDHVLAVAEKIRDQRLPIQIEVAGRDDGYGWLNSQIEKLGLQDVLIYKGECGEPRKFLCCGNVFLMMSRVEGMPNALMEAMSVGLPCISTRVGDVGRFCQDREHLRVIELGDVDAVITILKEFLQNWSEAGQMGNRARELCHSQFTAAAAADKVMLLLKDVKL